MGVVSAVSSPGEPGTELLTLTYVYIVELLPDSGATW